MSKQELELIKRFWFAYHKESLTCGETDQLHQAICLEVAALLNSGGVCYRELRMSKKCGCRECKNRPAQKSAELGLDSRPLFGKVGHSKISRPA